MGPQTLGKAAPQVWPAGQVPHSMTLPQPSLASPQSNWSFAQVVGQQSQPPPVPPVPVELVAGAPPVPVVVVLVELVAGAPPVLVVVVLVLVLVLPVAPPALLEAPAVATVPLHAPIAATATSEVAREM